MREQRVAGTEPGRVHHVVLTGGPGGGKTTTLAHLTAELGRRGWQVLTVPEAATMLVTSGVGDLADLVADPHLAGGLQETVVATQSGLRDAYHRLATAFAAAGRNVVVLHDRGLADNAAYTDATGYTSALSASGLDPDAVWGLYDAVIHLRSAAVPAPGYDASAYTCANNAARTEDAATAAALDAATLHAWAGHPHLFVVSSANDLATKLGRALAAVLTVIGDPEPLEIERKFLLTGAPDLADPLLAGATVSRITQTYLAGGDGEQRVRARTTATGTTYVHTTKTDVGDGTRVEVESPISAQTYELLRTLAVPGTGEVVKTRRVFFVGDHRFELDEFHTPDVGWVCEVELYDAGDPVAVPECLGDVTEVTDDPAWRNANLARLAPTR